MKAYAVIYRTGGTERFAWHRVLDTYTREKAQAVKEEIERMGYKAIVHDAKQLSVIGLPETWE